MLNDTKIKALRRRSKLYREPDAFGLSLEVPPSGALRWRLRYRFAGKAKMIGLGVYPVVTLAQARDRRSDAQKLIAAGVDPSAERQDAKKAAAIEAEQAAAIDTFGAVAAAWLASRDAADITIMKARWIVETFLLPDLGDKPIDAITPRALLVALRKVEATGKLETAKRCKITAGQIFRWAIIEGRCDSDPTASLRGALKTPQVKHHAAVTDPKMIGDLLRAIDGYTGQPVTLAALKFAPLVFVRPGELRKALWAEFDLDGAMWRIPAERMKMGKAHLVPLSKQAVAIMRDLYKLTGAGEYVFPSTRSAFRPMSENTVNAALRGLGYDKNTMTGHGFRSMAATRLNEMGWRADAIERQLAHVEANKVRAAYIGAAEHIEERKRMMTAWSDYLDVLRTGGTVTPMRRKRA